MRLIVLFAALVAASGATHAADLGGGNPGGAPGRTGRFLATCEHLGRFCFAEGCGRDQIDAALACRAACPGSVTMQILPVACPLPGPAVRVVLRRRG